MFVSSRNGSKLQEFLWKRNTDTVSGHLKENDTDYKFETKLSRKYVK